MAPPKQLTITMSPEQRGVAEEAIGIGHTLLKKLQGELHTSAGAVRVDRADGILLMTLLAQLPNADQPPIKPLMDNLRLVIFPAASGGGVIHFPPT